MERDLNLKATELRLGLPGREEEFDHQQIVSNSKNNKRALSEYEDDESISHYEATTPHVTKRFHRKKKWEKGRGRTLGVSGGCLEMVSGRALWCWLSSPMRFWISGGFGQWWVGMVCYRRWQQITNKRERGRKLGIFWVGVLCCRSFAGFLGWW
uniref:Nt-iaa2.3 deduced protein n=1 Tax=Solanum tuberosum TaxID=4113 RepID=M1DG62_SOLTU